MIHALYIITRNGLCIYNKVFTKSLVDEVLLSGFLTAASSFAVEALGGGLQRLNIQTGEQLVVFHVETQGLTIAAIANANDHPALLTKILRKVEECFTDMFGEKIDEPDVVSETRKFDERLDEILKGKSAKRGWAQVAQGLILGSIILALLWILVIPLTVNIIISIIVQTVQIALNFISPLRTDAIANAFLDGAAGTSIILQFLIVFTLLPCSFVSGYVAGNSRLGKWTGIVFLVLQPIISVIGGLFAFTNVYLIALLIFFPLSIFTAVGMGYLGGLLKERRKLYPIGATTGKI